MAARADFSSLCGRLYVPLALFSLFHQQKIGNISCFFPDLAVFSTLHRAQRGYPVSARPIRTQVGHDMGVSAINDATAPIQSAFVEGIKPVYLGASAEAAE